MAGNFTPVNLTKFGKKSSATASTLDKALLAVAILTAAVLATLIIILVRRNGA